MLVITFIQLQPIGTDAARARRISSVVGVVRRPARAGWDGLTPAEICAALKDPARNAGLTPAQVVEHMAKDPLVLWAWAPGSIRGEPPLGHAAFLDLMRTWRAGGAPCPG